MDNKAVYVVDRDIGYGVFESMPDQYYENWLSESKDAVNAIKNRLDEDVSTMAISAGLGALSSAILGFVAGRTLFRQKNEYINTLLKHLESEGFIYNLSTGNSSASFKYNGHKMKIEYKPDDSYVITDLVNKYAVVSNPTNSMEDFNKQFADNIRDAFKGI